MTLDPTMHSGASFRILHEDASMNDQRTTVTTVASPLSMLISAMIFGYFGFATDWVHRFTTDEPPKLIIPIALLMWTMRISAVSFLLCAMASAPLPRTATIVFSIVGILGSLIFLGIGLW